MNYLVTVFTDKEYEVARVKGEGDAYIILNALGKLHANYRLYKNGVLKSWVNGLDEHDLRRGDHNLIHRPRVGID